MKISKHTHSCLLVEDQEKIILIDPGIYSIKTGALKIENIKALDAICITHEHLDHLDILTLKTLIQKFPKIEIFSNNSVKQILEKENIIVNTIGNSFIKMQTAKHERIWGAPNPPCENVVVTVFGKLSHVGDSLSFTNTAEILALPVQASWTSTTRSVEKALEIRPRYIIPIHDWQWKDEVRINMYKNLEEFFKQNGIIFLKIENNKVFEI